MNEPFIKQRGLGWILGPDSRKMSKRWGNIITPDDVIKQYGADTMRTYEMFMAPFEVDKAWNVNSVAGVHRFLNRIYKLSICAIQNPVKIDNSVVLQTLNKTISKVGHDIENFRFNTAVSSMMEFVNAWEKAGNITSESLKTFLLILAPFAPHLAEELWSNISNLTNLTNKSNSIHQQPWPKVNEANLTEETITIIVSVNGKARDTIKISTLDKEMLEKERIIKAAKSLDRVAKYLDGKTIKKTIYVHNKIINFVI